MHELELLSTFAAALLAAVLGSVHCLAMCGPLRMLIGADRKSRILYQTGRASAYALLGAGAGAAGSALPLSGLIVFVVVAGLLILAPFRIAPQIPLLAKFRLLAAGHPLLLGMSSGLLPCGLLHGWLVAAAGTASAARGALLLGALWAGSLPALEIAPTLLAKPLQRLKSAFPRTVLCLAIGLAAAPALWRAHLVYSTQGSGPECHSTTAPAKP